MWKVEAVGAQARWDKVIFGPGGEGEAVARAVKLYHDSYGQNGAPQKYAISIDQNPPSIMTPREVLTKKYLFYDEP